MFHEVSAEDGSEKEKPCKYNCLGKWNCKAKRKSRIKAKSCDGVGPLCRQTPDGDIYALDNI